MQNKGLNFPKKDFTKPCDTFECTLCKQLKVGVKKKKKKRSKFFKVLLQM